MYSISLSLSFSFFYFIKAEVQFGVHVVRHTL